MKIILAAAALVASSSAFKSAAHAAQPWQQVTMSSAAEAAQSFPNPPAEYGAIHWAIWGGMQTKERIAADIARIHAAGGTVYMINNSRGVQPKYLSPEYMDLVKTVVSECKKNGMKVWIETDCGYPDGFAGGLISQKYPQLGMKGIAIDATCTVASGATIDMALPVDTLGIIARPAANVPASAAGEAQTLPPAGTPFKYAAPRGKPGTIVVQLANTEVRYTVTPGEPFAIPVPEGTKAITLLAGGGGGGARGGGGAGRGATEGGPAATVVPMPADGHLKWTAPAGGGAYQLEFVRHIFKTSPTRNDNGDDGGATKDTYYTLIDFLDPEACAAFTREIHETYAKAVGDEFGKTVLGFRGDETDFTNVTPWTPRLLDVFKAQKGYDLQPYIASFFVQPLSTEAQRARADYFDVWSGLFRDTFYKQQQEWCRARGMDYMVHLNHEEIMVNRANGEDMTKNEGSYFRDMRYVGVPGVDNLNQIGPGIVADFPKLAGSAAHLFGRSQAWSEEGGSLGAAGKFVFDYQLVRGIDFMNIRGMTGQGGGGGGGGGGAGRGRGQAGAATTPAPAAAAPAPAPASAGAAVGTGFYYTRAQYLMSIGRPAAQIALYIPTDSYWLNDAQADASCVKLTTQLMEHQIDFDHIDHDTLTTICSLDGGGLKNESGQIYRGIVIPTCSVIQKSMLERLKAFAAAGGKVVFVGKTPAMVVDKSFLHPEPGAPDLSFATLEPTGDITEKVIAALPKPDVALDSPCPPLKYLHRSLKDAEVYLFFNEGTDPITRNATLAGTGRAESWDPADGHIHPADSKSAATGALTVPLTLAPHETHFVVLRTQ